MSGTVDCFMVYAFLFLGVLPNARVWIAFASFGCPTCESQPKRSLSHVECHNQDRDRRPRYRPVVLYARRCFFWDLIFIFSEMGARSPCEQGRCGGAWIRRYVCEGNFRVVVVVPLLLITSLWQRRKPMGAPASWQRIRAPSPLGPVAREKKGWARGEALPYE